jgi:branched-chain amino acid transport system permease protein
MSILRTLLSDDAPRGRALAAILVAIVVGLAVAPFAFPGARALNTAATICVFVVLVASYDLLLGYTGIVSFAHTMFYGIGAYGVGLALASIGPTWWAVLAGLATALLVALLLALAIGVVSLRVRALFFAMITLAVASAFNLLASQLSDLTGGEDGRNFSVPELLRPSYRLIETEVLGRAIDGRVLTYYLVFASSITIFLVLLRIVNSHFGRVLLAIRENDFRAEALGYRAVVYRALANCIAALAATLAGALMALWLRYVGPKTMLSFEVMTDILLIVVIGGMGRMYGAILGSVLFVIAQNYLQAAMAGASERVGDVPVLARALHPDRWMLWMGLAFIACVYYFPTGIVGRLRGRAR